MSADGVVAVLDRLDADAAALRERLADRRRG
jgi:hypothetical protein